MIRKSMSSLPDNSDYDNKLIPDFNQILFSKQYPWISIGPKNMESGNVEYNRAIYGTSYCSTYHISPYGLDTIQTFLCELGMKPHTYLCIYWKSTFFHFIMSLSDQLRNIKWANKNWAHFLEIKYFDNQNFQNFLWIKLNLLIQYSENQNLQSLRRSFILLVGLRMT